MTTDTRHPALGPGVWTVLLRNEWFKARHRTAFVVTLGFYAFIQLMDHGDDFLRARGDDDSTHALPEAWSSIFSDDSVLLLIFGSIALMMLVSSEFTWRTARQNVIDGLAKTQWFWGKVMLLVLVGLVFLSTKIIIGGGAALLGTDLSSEAGPIVPSSVLAASASLLLAFLSVGGLALLLALTVRNSGPAIAVWFFWIAFGEQLVPSLIARLVPAAEPVLAMLPFSASQRVMSFWIFDAPTYARMVARAEAAGEAAPELPDVAMWLGVNAGWAIVFLVAAFVLFRRKDL